MNTENTNKRLSIWYIIPLILTFILILPPILSLPPFWPKNSINKPGLAQWLMVAPFYLGLLAFPGYYYAWNGHYKGSSISGWKKRWIQGSLIAGVLASLIGGIMSILTVVVAPFAF